MTDRTHWIAGESEDCPCHICEAGRLDRAVTAERARIVATLQSLVDAIPTWRTDARQTLEDALDRIERGE